MTGFFKETLGGLRVIGTLLLLQFSEKRLTLRQFNESTNFHITLLTKKPVLLRSGLLKKWRHKKPQLSFLKGVCLHMTRKIVTKRKKEPRIVNAKPIPYTPLLHLRKLLNNRQNSWNTKEFHGIPCQGSTPSGSSMESLY